MTLELQQQLRSAASTVDEFILSMLEGSPRDLYLASAHYIRSGGKRLRPFLVIKSCELLGGSAKSALPVAAAIELVHNFTLVHDDIMDKDEMRHQVSTVHTQYGIPLAILAGDVLFMKAIQAIAAHGPRAGLPDEVIVKLTARLARSCIDVSEGQALDIAMASSSKIPSESEYIKMIGKKTATLFETSCELGAICAQTREEDADNLASYGRNLGVAFQIVDDLIGAAGDPKVTKKPVGNDIREGKKTLPILLAVKKAKPADREKILKVFGARNVSNRDLKQAVNVIIESGVDREVRKMARFYATRAIDSIKQYKDNKAKRSLQSLANFFVERTL